MDLPRPPLRTLVDSPPLSSSPGSARGSGDRAVDTPRELGDFRVIRRLAQGGTSDIFLARAAGAHASERRVVLKLLLQRFADDAVRRRRFARALGAYTRLSHPTIVSLYDSFWADGQLVLVLEYVDGLALNKLRAILNVAGQRLEDAAALLIAIRIFSALSVAHAARDAETRKAAAVIHGDVNPSNVLVSWDGDVKLADFGVAQTTGIQGDTKSGFIKGTYGYMAPEQVRGEKATSRSDVYACALLAWELLARRKAIQRGALPEVEVLRAMALPAFPSLDTLRPDLDASVREVVRRGLEPDPERRTLTPAEMAGVLGAVCNEDEALHSLVGTLTRIRLSSREPAASASQPPEEPDTSLSDTWIEPRKSFAAAGEFAAAHAAAPERNAAVTAADPDETARLPTLEPEALIEEPQTTERDAPAPSEPLPTLDEPFALSHGQPPGTLPLPPTSGPNSQAAAVGFVRVEKKTRPETLRFGPSLEATGESGAKPIEVRAPPPSPKGPDALVRPMPVTRTLLSRAFSAPSPAAEAPAAAGESAPASPALAFPPDGQPAPASKEADPPTPRLRRRRCPSRRGTRRSRRRRDA